MFIFGLFTCTSTFFNLSIENSLFDLLIPSSKIYFGIGNENTTDYNPLNFHEYYYNQTLSNILDFNINLISILNIFGSLLLNYWGYIISYSFFLWLYNYFYFHALLYRI